MVVLLGEVLELFEYYPAKLVGIGGVIVDVVNARLLSILLKDGLLFVMMGLLLNISLFCLLLDTCYDLLLLDGLYDIDEILLDLLLERAYSGEELALVYYLLLIVIIIILVILVNIIIIVTIIT